MTHAVGIRAYRIFVTRRGSNKLADPEDENLRQTLPLFLKQFITDHSKAVDNTALEKVWRLTPSKEEPGNFRGLISYGRYGYAASIQDTKTGKENYKRKITDSEIIELYYRFWSPDREKFILSAFSSFSGRSCITIIFEEMKQSFEKMNPGFLLKFNKLMPSGASAKIYAGKPVKNIRLVTNKPRNDIADRLFHGRAQKTSKMTITIHSSRNGTLGNFTDLMDSLPADTSGVIQYDGLEFDQAVAMVKVGNDVRPVGVFGAHSDVGVVDVTENIVKNDDGFPTFESLDREASRILIAMYETLNGQRI